MDKRIIDGFIYLSKAAKIPVWEQEELLDIICEHEFQFRSGHGQQWERCVRCDRLRNVVNMDIKLNNFSGGLNINVAPDDLPEQTIELCENWECVVVNADDVKEHNCDNMDEYARIGISKGGNWFLHTGDPADSVWINYCPFCGEKLP